MRISTLIAALVCMLVILLSAGNASARNPFTSGGASPEKSQAADGEALSAGPSPAPADGEARSGDVPSAKGRTPSRVAADGTTAGSSSSPFGSRSSGRVVRDGGGGPGLFGPVINKVSRWQRKLKREISGHLKAFRDGGGSLSAMTLLLVSFIYGVVHAVGPGHGKAMAASYFLGRRARMLHGFATGMLMGFTHAASALVIVFAAHFFFSEAINASLDSASGMLQRVSFGIIAGIGLMLTLLAVRSILRRENPFDEEHHHGAGSMTAVALAGGLVPCPGAAVVMVFTLSLGLTHLGVLAVLFMALGMGLTIGLTAVLAICCRTSVVSAVRARPGVAVAVHGGLRLMGGLLVLGMGLLLFAASL